MALGLRFINKYRDGFIQNDITFKVQGGLGEKVDTLFLKPPPIGYVLKKKVRSYPCQKWVAVV